MDCQFTLAIVLRFSTSHYLMPKKNTAKKGLPFPIRLDVTERTLIKNLQKQTDPAMSVSEIIRRAIRYYCPLAVNGTAPVTSLRSEAVAQKSENIPS